MTTSSGSLTVNGTSCGTESGSRGVFLTSSANISATGAGNVTITGTAANGTNQAYGIQIRGSNVTTSSGSLTVNGTSCGTGTFYVIGVLLTSSANISATGVGNVTITGSTPGNFSTGVGINVIDAASKVYANGGMITLTASSLNLAGKVNATGTGGISMTGRNIVVTGNITTEAGDISLTGNNGSYQTGTFDGVCISGSGVNVNTTSGNITIDGRAGGGSVNAGVNLTSSKVQAGVSGCVSITGVSGNGNVLFARVPGILASAATVTTSSGSLSVNGTSCGTGCDSMGVLLTSSNISATGTGNVTITGTAANGTDYAYGIVVGGSTVTTSSGSLTVNGTSCGTGWNSRGVFLTSSNISATGAGYVTITGTAAI